MRTREVCARDRSFRYESSILDDRRVFCETIETSPKDNLDSSVVDDNCRNILNWLDLSNLREDGVEKVMCQGVLVKERKILKGFMYVKAPTGEIVAVGPEHDVDLYDSEDTAELELMVEVDPENYTPEHPEYDPPAYYFFTVEDPVSGRLPALSECLSPQGSIALEVTFDICNDPELQADQA